MRVKLKYVLPVSQMALAAVTIWWFYLWINLADRFSDAPGLPAAFQAILFVNAPVSIARDFFYDVSPRWSDALYIASVGILWYWVAQNIDSWHERKAVFIFTSMPLRIATDLLLIGLGPYAVWQFRNIDLRVAIQLYWEWSVVSGVFILVWLFGLPFIFGRDLVQMFAKPLVGPPHAAVKAQCDAS